MFVVRFAKGCLYGAGMYGTAWLIAKSLSLMLVKCR